MQRTFSTVVFNIVSSLISLGGAILLELASPLDFLLRRAPTILFFSLIFLGMGTSSVTVSCSCHDVQQVTIWGCGSKKQFQWRYYTSPFLTLSRAQYWESRLLLTCRKVSPLSSLNFQCSFFQKNRFSIKLRMLILSLLHPHYHRLKLKPQLTMNSNPSMAENAHVLLPPSGVRTISLEKLKQPIPLAEHHHNQSIGNAKGTSENEAKRMYQKILERKASSKLLKDEKMQQQSWNSKQLVSKKIQQLKREVDEKEMKQCTFKPYINPSEKNNRTVSQFFNDQISYDQKKNDKIEEMRIILENNRQKQNTFRPNAILSREKTTGNQASNQVYQRLYQDSKNKDKSQAISRQESTEAIRNNSITSSKRFRGISKGSSGKKALAINLKEDSLTPAITSRQLHTTSINTQYISSELSAVTTRKQSTELGHNRSKQGGRVQKQSCQRGRKESRGKQGVKRVDVNILQKKDNSKNQQIYIGKLMKEMSIVLSKCKLPLVLSYMEMNLFLQKMNLVSSSDNQRRHVYEIWNTLQGEVFQEVSALSVMKIIYSILGCHNVQLVNKCIYETWLSDSTLIQEQEEELKKMGKRLSFKQNMLMLSERDSATIKQSYQQLYLNRMKTGESQLLKEPKASEFSFKPSLSKATEHYAEMYRNRMLSQTEKLLAQNKISYLVPQNGEIDHVDLLMLDEKRKQAVLQKKREEKEKQKRRAEDESISNPNTTERESSKSSRNTLNQKDRNQELFQMGKHCNQHKKDKTSDEIEEEKWKNELTFKPVLHSKQNIVQQFSQKQNFIPDYDKAVYRMHEARKSKEQSPKQDDSPLLYLNVVMEGSQSVKVPVYQSDTMRSITEKVRVMMQLSDQADNGKLQRILKMQILPVLKQMNLCSLMN